MGNSSAKLHIFWDDLLGPTGATPKAVIKTAKKFPAANATKASDLNVSRCVNEGVQNAKNSVYVGPVGLGPGPFTVTTTLSECCEDTGEKAGGVGWRTPGESAERRTEIVRTPKDFLYRPLARLFRSTHLIDNPAGKRILLS